MSWITIEKDGIRFYVPKQSYIDVFKAQDFKIVEDNPIQKQAGNNNIKGVDSNGLQGRKVRANKNKCKNNI